MSEFYEFTGEEIAEASRNPEVHRDKEHLIRERINILRDSIVTVLRGGGIDIDPKIVALVAEDEEVRQRFEESLDIPPEKQTFDFRELYLRKAKEKDPTL